MAKQQQQAVDPHAGHNHGSNPHQAPTLKYEVPEGWEEMEPGEMRAASFRLKAEGQGNADVGVFPLPGLAGGDLGNVNRWRGQVGLEPIAEQELATLAEEVEIAETMAQLYDLSGETPGSGEKTRILAAILRQDGMVWFFKMTGDDPLVAAQKSAFKQFLESVRFESSEPELPPSHPPIPMAGARGPLAEQAATGSAQESSEDLPNWTVPERWKEAPAGQFLAAKYQITGEGGKEATVNVSVSAGEGGGVAGNVNRWRGQLGLQVLPAEDLKLDKVQTQAGTAVVADLSGTDARTSQPARILGAVVPAEGKTWFYKLMGDENIVEREKDAFIQFLTTAKY